MAFDIDGLLFVTAQNPERLLEPLGDFARQLFALGVDGQLQLPNRGERNSECGRSAGIVDLGHDAVLASPASATRAIGRRARLPRPHKKRALSPRGKGGEGVASAAPFCICSRIQKKAPRAMSGRGAIHARSWAAKKERDRKHSMVAATVRQVAQMRRHF